MAVDVCQEMIRGGFTIVAAVTAAVTASWLAVKVFLRQKEFELVRQRYLEGALDAIAAHHETVMGIFRHNWARSFQLTALFRDSGESFDVTELQRGFLDLDSSRFHVVAHQRLEVLVGTQVFWEVYQLALSFAVNANGIVTKDIPDVFRLKLTTDKVNASFEDIAEQSFKQLRELDEESHKFAVLTWQLEVLAGALQTEQLTFKHISAFRERAVVKAAIERLRTDFAQDLAAIPGLLAHPSLQTPPAHGRGNPR